MSLTATLTPSSRVLIGNPLRLGIASDGTCRYTVSVDGSEVYSGSGHGTFHVFLQDIIAPYLTPQLCYNSDTRLLIPLSTCCKSCSVTVTSGTDTRTISFTAYPGGVSRTVLRSLGSGNIFTERFLKSTGNIFFSLRGTDSLILIRETEITPLLFVYPPSGTLSIRCNGETVSLPGTAYAMYALNLEAVRRSFYEDHDFIGSFFELLLNGSLVISIGITQSSLSKDRYLLRFLNSLGAYDLLECTGSAKRGSEYDDDSSYEEYDDTVDGYVRRRDRRKSRQSLSVSTGLLDEDRLLFIEDLLASEDVTLLGYHGRDVRVIPSVEDLSVLHNAFRPQSLTISLTMADEDDRFSTDDIDSMLGDGRIHTSEFTEQFN